MPAPAQPQHGAEHLTRQPRKRLPVGPGEVGGRLHSPEIPPPFTADGRYAYQAAKPTDIVELSY